MTVIKKRRCIFLFISVILSLAGIVMIRPFISQATSETVEIIIHKRVFTQTEQQPEPLQETGTSLETDTSALLQQSEGKNGATFAAFDVTDFLAASTGRTLAEKQQRLNRLSLAEITAQFTKVTEQTTSYDAVLKEAGIARFQLEKKQANQQPKAYLFTQLASVNQTSDYYTSHLLVALPVLDEEQKERSQIHLYPKEIWQSQPPTSSDSEKTGITENVAKKTRKKATANLPKAGTANRPFIFLSGWLLILFVGFGSYKKRKGLD